MLRRKPSKEAKTSKTTKWVMDMKMADEESQRRQPLLEPAPGPVEKAKKTLIQKTMKKTFKTSGNLANLLPTGSVLTFQFFSPIFSNQGKCNGGDQVLTSALIALCGVLCSVLCFTDSFRDSKGKVRYGLATIKGLWVIDSPVPVKFSPEEAARYRLKFIDFVHAFMSMFVFAAVVLFDQNVVNCFCPAPSERTNELLKSIPIGIGIGCSMLFVIFPSKRNGVGFPLSSR